MNTKALSPFATRLAELHAGAVEQGDDPTAERAYYQWAGRELLWGHADAILALVEAAREVASTLPTYVDVTHYGAKGDGVTDDTAGFQAAINASHALANLDAALEALNG